MKRTILAVAAVMAMTACAGSEGDGAEASWPEVSESYSLRGAIPSCWDDVREQHESWLSPPEHFCAWTHATLEGAPYESISIRWRLDGERWTEVARQVRGL